MILPILPMPREIFHYDSGMTATYTIDDFNRMPADAADALLARCCASAKWCARMTAARPYRSCDELIAAADAHWREMTHEDVVEAMSAHPRIGQKDIDSHGDAHGGDMARGEQAGMADASAKMRETMARHNRDYEQKFGFIFIICASGKSAAQMCEAIRARLENDAQTEIATAAVELGKITRIRIDKLFR